MFRATYDSHLIIILVSLMLNAFDDNTAIRRKHNIINIRFPVYTSTYNQYNVVYYVIEEMLASFLTYTYIIIDKFFIISCLMINAQYQILSRSFVNIQYDNRRHTGKKMLYKWIEYNNVIFVIFVVLIVIIILITKIVFILWYVYNVVVFAVITEHFEDSKSLLYDQTLLYSWIIFSLL